MYFPAALLTAFVAAASWNAAAAAPGPALTLFAGRRFEGTSQSFNSLGQCTDVPAPLKYNVSSLIVRSDITCLLFSDQSCRGEARRFRGPNPTLGDFDKRAASFICIL
ncbi:hypothetical protein BD779DRAFT_1673122 [Infundibulicybe gibba]|nr:hypothetical protein BD779DRAFT_1673122 [Infundibulicybe gibba]